jgi:hypothetical protein
MAFSALTISSIPGHTVNNGGRRVKGNVAGGGNDVRPARKWKPSARTTKHLRALRYFCRDVGQFAATRFNDSLAKGRVWESVN